MKSSILCDHGRRGPAVFAEDAPAFFTTDRRGAEQPPLLVLQEAGA